jgi:hypothetical protein
MKVSQAEPLETTLLNPEQFRSTSEFRKFKGIMRRILAVPKADLDQMVQEAKKASPRAGNPDAPGRKRKRAS